MRRVGCSCEVSKAGFWEVGFLPQQIAEKLDFEFVFWVAQRFTAAITGSFSKPDSAAEGDCGS